MLHAPFWTREARVDDPARLEEAFGPGSVRRIEVEKTRRGDMKVLLSRTDSKSENRLLAIVFLPSLHQGRD
jgi:hypothetical protein